MHDNPAPPLKLNAQSPWGRILHWNYRGIYAQVIECGTAGHGGIKLSRKLNNLIPKAFRKAGGWYEEDCEWAIPACFLPEDIAADAWPNRVHALDVLRRYFWQAYEALTGEVLAPGKSSAKDREVHATTLFHGHRILFSNLGMTLADGSRHVLSYSCTGSPYGTRQNLSTHLIPKEEFDALPRVMEYVVIPLDAPTIEDTLATWPDVPTFAPSVRNPGVGRTPKEYLQYLHAVS